MDVGDVVAILDGVEAQCVGDAMGDAPLEPAARHHDRKCEWMMVAAIGALRAGRAAEFGADD